MKILDKVSLTDWGVRDVPVCVVCVTCVWCGHDRSVYNVCVCEW